MLGLKLIHLQPSGWHKTHGRCPDVMEEKKSYRKPLMGVFISIHEYQYKFTHIKWTIYDIGGSKALNNNEQMCKVSKVRKTTP